MQKIAAILVVQCLLFACSSREKEVEQAMHDYDRFIFQMASDSIANCFAATGQLGGVGSPLITGRDSIRIFLRNFDASSIRMISNQSKIKSISFHRDTAVMEGRYEQKAEVNGKPGVYTGDFQSKWLQDNTGRWLLQWMFTVPDKKN